MDCALDQKCDFFFNDFHFTVFFVCFPEVVGLGFYSASVSDRRHSVSLTLLGVCCKLEMSHYPLAFASSVPN